MSKELLPRNRHYISSFSDSNRIRTYNHLVSNRPVNHLAKLAKWLNCVLSTYLHCAFNCMFLSHQHTHFKVNPHFIVALMSNVNELLAGSTHEIWSLSDSNVTQNHNNLVRKRTLDILPKLAKWLSCLVNTYLYGTLDCIFLSCHIRTLESIHTL